MERALPAYTPLDAFLGRLAFRGISHSNIDYHYFNGLYSYIEYMTYEVVYICMQLCRSMRVALIFEGID